MGLALGALALGAAPAQASEEPPQRTQFTQTVTLPDGSFETTVSRAPLNYRSSSGAWRPIDSTLVRRTDGTFDNAANSLDVEIPADASDAVRVVDGEHALGFALAGGSSASDVAVQGSEATFDAALPGVDVTYEAKPSGVKETLVLDSPAAPTSFEFDVDADGLDGRLLPSGEIVFEDEAGQRRFQLDAPWVRDAGGDLARAAHYSLEEQGDRVTVGLAIDPSWIEDEARRFPVVVDPTVWSDPLGWCELTSGTAANLPRCGASMNWVGRNGSQVHRTVIALDDLADVAPDDALVLSGSLDLGFAGQGVEEPSTLDVHHVTRDFSPRATWNRYDGRSLWTTPGGDFRPTREARRTMDPLDIGGWVSFDVTELTQQMLEGSEPSRHLMVKAADESAQHIDLFDAYVLKFHWVPRTGISDLYTYETFPLGDGSVLRHNVGNGNLVLSADDLEFAGDDGRLTVGRVINSLNLDEPATTFGRGSRGDFSSITLERNWLDGSYLLRGSTGLDGVFHRRIDGTFAAPEGNAAVLIENGDGSVTLDFNDAHETWTFAAGSPVQRLVQMRQDDGYQIDAQYAGARINSLTDTDGSSATFAYDGPTGDMRSITDETNAVHRYDYDGGDRLVRYTAPGGDATEYDYDSSGRLTTITVEDGSGLEIDYVTGTDLPAAITPFDSAGIDQPGHTYDGGGNFTTSEVPGTGDRVFYYDNRLRVDLTQHDDAPAAAADGEIPGLADKYVRALSPLTLTARGAHHPDGIRQLSLRANGVPFDAVTADCSSGCPQRFGGQLLADLSSEPEGAYGFVVRATDGGYGTGDSPTWTLRVDRTAPPSAATGFAGEFDEQTGELHVGWTAGTSPNLGDGTPGAPIVSYEVRYQRNGGAWSSWQPTTANGLDLTGATLGEVVGVEVRATDAAGNVTPTASGSITVEDPPAGTPLPDPEPLDPDIAADCDSYQEARNEGDTWVCWGEPEVTLFAMDRYHWDYARTTGYYGTTRGPVGSVYLEARVSLTETQFSFNEMALRAVTGPDIRQYVNVTCWFARARRPCPNNGLYATDMSSSAWTYNRREFRAREGFRHPWGRNYRMHFNFYWRAKKFYNPTSRDGRWHATPIPVSYEFKCRRTPSPRSCYFVGYD